MSKAFRATETGLYTQCPMAWHLRKQGWEHNVIGAKEVAACLGTAFHAGAEYLMLHQSDLDGAQDLARESLIKVAGEVYNSGRVVKPDVEAELDALPQRVINAVAALGKSLSLFDPYEIIATELKLASAGNTTIDLVLREKATGYVGILDWKCKTFKQPWYKSQFISDFEQAWQLKHYCWGYEHETGEPVDFFLLGLVDVTTKAKVELHTYHVNETDMEHWRESATVAWQEMEAIENGELFPRQNASCRTQYGRCEYYNMCFLHQYRDTATVDYTKGEGL